MTLSLTEVFYLLVCLFVFGRRGGPGGKCARPLEVTVLCSGVRHFESNVGV